jgi:hypothetical protein
MMKHRIVVDVSKESLFFSTTIVIREEHFSNIFDYDVFIGFFVALISQMRYNYE